MMFFFSYLLIALGQATGCAQAHSEFFFPFQARLITDNNNPDLLLSGISLDHNLQRLDQAAGTSAHVDLPWPAWADRHVTRGAFSMKLFMEAT